MQIDNEKIYKRLGRIETMIAGIVHKQPEAKPKRLAESKVVELYGYTKHTLKRMRLGYRRPNGVEVAPVLFKWGHVKGRRIDYDVAEFENAIKPTMLYNM